MTMPFARSLPALAVSLALHCSLSLVPRAIGLLERALGLDVPASETVAMTGSSLETDAPTPDRAASASAPDSEIEVESSLDPLPEAPPAVPAVTPESESASAALPPKAPPVARPATTQPRRSSPKPRAASAPRAPSAPAAGSVSAPGAPAAGTFGAEGLAPGVRRLGYAFTRAIPVATPADPSWRELPPGLVGTIRIQLAVDDDGRLGKLELWQARPGEPPPPAALLRMVERTLLLLRAGQFALSGSNRAGRERLTIEVHLRDESADDEPTQEVVQKKFDGAAPGHPGKAFFRYGTGRVFEAKVTTTPAPN
ncbi:MAG TPA: hypothetical protein VIW29_18300 [Polyangiaceae bacterium]